MYVIHIKYKPFKRRAVPCFEKNHIITFNKPSRLTHITHMITRPSCIIHMPKAVIYNIFRTAANFLPRLIKYPYICILVLIFIKHILIYILWAVVITTSEKAFKYYPVISSFHMGKYKLIKKSVPLYAVSESSRFLSLYNN